MTQETSKQRKDVGRRLWIIFRGPMTTEGVAFAVLFFVWVNKKNALRQITP